MSSTRRVSRSSCAFDLEVDARSWIERSGAEHPQLVDTAHRLDELLGVVNVPSALWIDEDGMIVRLPHTAAVERYDFSKLKAPEGLPDDLDAHIRDMLEQVKRIPRSTPTTTWRRCATGWSTVPPASTRLADEVVRKSAPRPPAVAEAAAAEFELGQHLHHAGTSTTPVHTSVPPTAFIPTTGPTSATPGSSSPGIQGPTDFYDGDWLSDIKAAGPEHYYAPPDF